MYRWLFKNSRTPHQPELVQHEDDQTAGSDPRIETLLGSDVKKRKAQENDSGYDSDTIVVHQPGPLAKKRATPRQQTLQQWEQDSIMARPKEEAAVKRRRVVGVLVPKFAPESFLAQETDRSSLSETPVSQPQDLVDVNPSGEVFRRSTRITSTRRRRGSTVQRDNLALGRSSPTPSVEDGGDNTISSHSQSDGSVFDLADDLSSGDDLESEEIAESDDDETFASEPESELSFQTSKKNKKHSKGTSSQKLHINKKSACSPNTKDLITNLKPAEKHVSSKKQMVSLLQKTDGKGLDGSLPPLFDIEDIFQDITEKALRLGLREVIDHLGQRPIRVATMCSGTESPLLALKMIQDALLQSGSALEVVHLFSAEIVPYKQAYIERNFAPKIIFRDITELVDAVEEKVPTATTAYGAQVPIPTDVDVVIAGTSCVDFSRLNNRRKGINEDGESAKTWEAVLAFNKTFRPAVVILENVLGADWDAMLACYRNLNYEAAGALVDTKNFYIPHTRQRGYMVCFDRARNTNTKDIGKHWTELMEKFKRPASSPVTHFLEPNDKISLAQERLAIGDEASRDVDWTQCEITQMQYRQQKRLGTMRPFTQWQESGTMVVPENGQKSWYHGQVERVLDTIDCAVLRKSLDVVNSRSKELVTEGYDARYKTRIWDLSQNVYRFTDASAFGITSCITPSGIFYASDAGRKVTPIETLKLQGLPVNRITFTTETPSELQDLAGNAMSSTVVGSAILSALIAGFKTIEAQQCSVVDTPVASVAQITSLASTSPNQVKRIVYKHTLKKSAPGPFLRLARQAMRRCYCEGPSSLCVKPLQECNECHHTTCTACGGNPTHSYQQNPALSADRISPSTFVDFVKENLPLGIKLKGLDGLEKALSVWKDSSKQYLQAALAASNDTYTFVCVRRTSTWTIQYQSLHGRLELCVGDTFAEWRLYAKPGAQLPSNHSLRRTLASPVAKSDVSGSLTGDSWYWKVPAHRDVGTKLTLSGHGSRVASWWARNGMPDYQDRQIWQTLEVKGSSNTTSNQVSVDGTYVHLPKCGTACDSLYKRVPSKSGSNEQRPLFLFLDPDRVGSPNEDQFVFAFDKGLLEYDETRSVIARLDSRWRPWESGSRLQKAVITSAGDWFCLTDAALAVDQSDVNLETSSANDAQSSCERALKLVECRFEDSLLTGMTASARDIEEQDTQFYDRYAWALELMRQHAETGTWHDLDVSAVPYCDHCAPLKPTLKWKLMTDGQTVQPYEDPVDAAAYEHAIKTRPKALVLQTVVESGHLRLSLGVNVASLAHRAAGRLSHLTKHLQSNSGEDVSVRWVFEGSGKSSGFSFHPFKLRATKGADAKTYDGHTGMKIDLFTQQKEALYWMQQQETGIPLLLEEAEEQSIPHLGWRVEARAQRTIAVRGGICADHPGFGKTITSLALIGSEQKSDLLSELEERGKYAASGRIPIRATLIVSPNTLMKQWQAEIQEKLGWIKGRDVLILTSMSDIFKASLTDFRSAKIVLLSRSLLGNPTYAERVAAFAALPGPAVNTGRAFNKWMEYATDRFPDHIATWQSKGLTALKKIVTSEYKQIMEDGTFNALVPSRRLRGKAYAAAQHGKRGQSGVQTASATATTEKLDTPLLEMFYFNRLIADEFHDSDPKEYAALKHIRADKRWGLSATPALNDMYEVSQMAELLNIPLRYGSDARGVMKTKNVRKLRKELTSFEQFDSMRQRTSDALHTRIHALDQIFLDTFVRQNIMDLDVMRFEDHLVPVTLDLAHLTMYTELSQHLNSQDMRIKKAKKSRTSDRDKTLADATQGAESAEEALSKKAAFWDRGETTLQDFILYRESEADSTATKLRSAISEAKNIKNGGGFKEWSNKQLHIDSLGDESVASEISNMIDESSASSKSLKVMKQSEDKIAEFTSDERAKLAKCNTLAKVLVVARRSVRYLHNVSSMQRGISTCDRPQCHAQANSQMAVSAFCGHAICEICHRDLHEQHIARCPATGCSSAMLHYHLLWSHKIGDLATRASNYGAKIEAAVKLLTEFKRKGDQAILFVQFEEQLDQVDNALARNKISNIIVRDRKDAGQQIANFQQGSDATVIVLDASSETAAGSNLQRANHVIFLSPLLRDTQYSYESTMAQAIGRVRRHGQKKQIHVYRIVALDTIDVDILEHRERRSTPLVEQGHDLPECPANAAVENAHKPERTQLLRDENGVFSLQPQSWLLCHESEDAGPKRVLEKARVSGWEDFSSLVKFSKTFTEDDL